MTIGKGSRKEQRSWSWKDRKIAPRPCRTCNVEFQPVCGGNLYCAPCSVERRRHIHKTAMSTWRSNNRAHARRVKANWDLKRFNLTIEQYESMFDAQNGCCAICGLSPEGGRYVVRKLAVDHCHRTQKVRGLLCHPCNTAIGLLKEQPAILHAAADYLAKHSDGGTPE